MMNERIRINRFAIETVAICRTRSVSFAVRGTPVFLQYNSGLSLTERSESAIGVRGHLLKITIGAKRKLSYHYSILK